jgi:hypothetical protein
MVRIEEQGLPYFQKVSGFQTMKQTSANFKCKIVINVANYAFLSFSVSIIVENVVILCAKDTVPIVYRYFLHREGGTF